MDEVEVAHGSRARCERRAGPQDSIPGPFFLRRWRTPNRIQVLNARSPWVPRASWSVAF